MLEDAHEKRSKVTPNCPTPFDKGIHLPLLHSNEYKYRGQNQEVNSHQWKHPSTFGEPGISFQHSDSFPEVRSPPKP